MSKKVLFIDRDGTMIKEPADEQIDAFGKLIFYPKAFTFLGKIAKELDYELVMITNQDGLGTDSFPEDTFWPVHNFIMESFKNEGVVFDEVFLDRTFPHENANTRKPGTGLLTKYFSEDYDLENSFVIGDRLTDIELAKNLGAKGIFINDETNLGNEAIFLSGGQRQRIDLARIIVKKSKIMIFDEPTSNLDIESEDIFFESMYRIQKELNSTIIIVSHGLSAVQGADKIIVLKNGEVKEIGAHQDLVNNNGWYAKTWKIQSNYEV